MHTVTQIPIKLVVRRERDDAVFPDGVRYLKHRVTHLDVFLRQPVHGYRTAVVVRGHDDRLSVKPRLNGFLAGAVERISIGKADHLTGIQGQ